MNFEEQTQYIKAIRVKQLTWIYLLIGIDAFLLFYLYFGNGHLSSSIIKFFIFVTSVSVFFQIKNLKENPDKFKHMYILKGEKQPRDYSQAGRVADSIRNFSKVQFSKNTIGKAEEILNKSAAKRKEPYVEYREQLSDIRPNSQAENKYVEEERKQALKYKTRHDRSVLDEISMDWPSRILPDKQLNVTRDYRQKAHQQPSTTLVNHKNRYRTQAEYNNGKQSTQYLQRYDSNKDPKRTVSRYSSKGKASLQKSSINTKSFYQHEVPLDLDIINERQKNFQAVLANLHVDTRKYDYWVHHNIQVWLAFNFIPELVRRNQVS